MRTKTPQELFWEGAFGAEYTDRNQILPEERLPFFSQVLQKTYGVRSVCELGANKGHNLRAIAQLSPNYELAGVEINPEAFQELQAIPQVQAFQASIQEVEPHQQFDLVYTCGVLIHLNPDDLPTVYRKMYQLSARYILINEYYNPSPVELSYRGHGDRLFKRDFAAEFIEANQNRVSVVDYGFLWKPLNPTWDNTTWFLLEKTA